MEKPNCYKCKWRGSVPGDAHSCCRHPEVEERGSDMMGGIAAMLGGECIPATAKLGIKGNPHGIRNCWFLWPFNFDPVWLEACNGFEGATEGE